MSIITLTEALAFLDIGTGFFQITAENDILNMTYNKLVEDCEDAWNEQVVGSVTSDIDTTDKKEGAASVILTMAGGAAIGVLASELVALDLTGHKSITLWIKSSIVTASGNLQLLLDEDPNCASPLETLNLPALAADTWTVVTLTLSNPANLGSIISVGLKQTVDLGICIVHLDAIKATKDVEISDGTYEGDDLAVALEAAIDTAFSITSTVAYNSSTYKFTITVLENTITIDVSASDAALTFGFTSDPTADLSIVSDQAATEDPTAPVQVILDGVDSFVKGYCDRDFEVPSGGYKEYYNGKGKQNLFLKQYPIISISRLSIGRNDGIKVNNTATYTYATVSVTSTGVILNKDGTETTLLFADYAMLTDMVTQINLETNWQASVITSSYASYKSTELIEVMGLQCLNASWAYLEIPDEPESDFEVYADEGYLFKYGGFARGIRNIRIDYTAGYATLPSRLKLACLILVKFIYQKREEEVFGRKQYGLGNVRATLEAEMPGEVRLILDKFARKDV